MKEQDQVCPWCQTEIVWDEELGPEKVCPHCENELDGYRTVSFGVDRDDLPDGEDEEEQVTDDAAAARQRAFDEFGADSFRPLNARLIALEGKLEAMLNEQEEVPECPSCREYMLETGRQAIGAEGFKPTVHAAVRRTILNPPFELVWYVCPNCSEMHSRLAPADREKLLSRIEEA